MDSISFLPNPAIAKVLVKLPIKDAIRTSVLSSKWTLMPDLVFKDNFEYGNDLIEFVDLVLTKHQDRIETFEVDCKLKCNEASIDRWVPILCQKGIKDLRFHFGTNLDSNIPPSLFSCHNLERLEVVNCFINAPQPFQHPMLLGTLKLSHFELIGITMENLVSNCPLLESLELSEFVVDRLVIRSPSLRRLNLVGRFSAISLEIPNLLSASIFLDGIPDGPMNGSKNNISNFLGELSNIEELEILSMFYVYLGSGGTIPKKLPLTYDCLKKFVICMYGRRKKGVEVALCMFRSAPNLKTLYVRIPKQNIWLEKNITTDIIFEHLEMVRILGFEDAVSMLEFAEFILSSAPKLEKFEIDKDDVNDLGDGKAVVIEELRYLPRLSSKAVIFINCSSSN